MSGLFDWFDKRDFLERFENEVDLSRSGRTKCVGTKDCGAGFACIDGICQRINAPANNATGDTAGDCNNGEGGSSPCGSGSRACSDGGNCGTGSPIGSCCGQGVSYRVKDPDTGKFITSCENPNKCRPFCTSYFATFGVPGLGCENYDPCSADCEFCGIEESTETYQCLPKPTSGNVPCYCDNGARCRDCEGCITDPNNLFYGDCARFVDDPRCQRCIEKPSHYCCGKDVGPVTACNIGRKTASEVLDEKLDSLCQAACDQCEEYKHESYCSNLGNWDQRPNKLALPDGTTYTGFLEIDGVTCEFFTITDKSNCPDCPTTPVCNCHADCPPGQSCFGTSCG